MANKQASPAKGVYAALATPRRQDSIEADAGVLLDYLDWVARAGVDGLVLFGSTGEFVHYDVQERVRALSLAIRRSRLPMLVNVSHSTLQGAITLAEHAMEAGAAGVLLMPPYFYRYTGDHIFHFYEEFAEAIGKSIPAYLYNLPFFTNPISPELAVRLLRTGAFAGIKDSSGDWAMFEVLRDLHATQPFQLMVGNESLYLRGRLAGADGIVSGVAASLPELPVAIDRAICRQDLDRAGRLNQRLEELLAWLDRFPATIGIKQVAIARKWKHNHFAVPPDPLTAANLSEFQAWLAGWIPAVLSECAKKD
jgi:4-hydroxy-tetrahydrodipicolinate synthase